VYVHKQRPNFHGIYQTITKTSSEKKEVIYVDFERRKENLVYGCIHLNSKCRLETELSNFQTYKNRLTGW
jgi:hypothetical protein